MPHKQHPEGEDSGFVDFDIEAPSMQLMILDHLERHSEVTFIDLEEEIPGFAGDLSLKAPDNRNTILWRGVSSSGIYAISELARNGRIQFRQTSYRCYENKGRRLQLPVACWESERLHWTPVFVELRKH